ncbi:MAG: hypothetical protein M9958_03925 [Chitinophagales bacterium]|nr:hypothetical protein [Chitinophagales bacterium]
MLFLKSKNISTQEIATNNLRSNTEIDLNGYSKEFIAFVNEYEELISSINSYQEYKNYIINFNSNTNFLSNSKERQLAINVLFTTDILYQTMLNNEALENTNNARLTDWQYRCLGQMGMGILAGLQFGFHGAIIGLGLGALSC